MASDDADDPELQDLLDSALDDFDKLAVQPSSAPGESGQKIGQSDDTITASANKYQAGPPPPPPPRTASDLDTEAGRLADLFSSAFGSTAAGSGKGDSDAGMSPDELAKMVAAMESSLGEFLKETPEDDEDIRRVKQEARKLAEFEEKLTAPPEASQSQSFTSSESGPSDPAAYMAHCLHNLTSALPDWSSAPETGDDTGSPLEGLLQSMLRQLLDREVIYPPLAAVANRYPDWLKSRESELPAPELTFRRKQAGLIKKICDRYEVLGDRKPSDSELKDIMVLIEEAMREGPPPQDLVDEITRETGEDGRAPVDDERLNFLLRERNIDPSSCPLM